MLKTSSTDSPWTIEQVDNDLYMVAPSGLLELKISRSQIS